MSVLAISGLILVCIVALYLLMVFAAFLIENGLKNAFELFIYAPLTIYSALYRSYFYRKEKN